MSTATLEPAGTTPPQAPSRNGSSKTEAASEITAEMFLPGVSDAPLPAHVNKLVYEIQSDRMVTLTKSLCTTYLNLTPFPGERRVAENNTQHLVDEITSQTFNPSNVTLASAWFKDVHYKINGQHTCWSWLLVKKALPYSVRRVVYRVASMEQLKLLYNSFDRNRPRSDNFSLAVLLNETPASQDLWPAMLVVYAQGLKFWLAGDDRSKLRRMSASQVSQLVKDEYSTLFRAVGLFLQKDSNYFRPGMRRAAVVAAMFATFAKNSRQAVKFWQPVADGLGLTDKGDPRYRLREVLERSVSHASSARGRERERMYLAPEETYRIAIGCWNAWRGEESMQATPRATKNRVDPV